MKTKITISILLVFSLLAVLFCPPFSAVAAESMAAKFENLMGGSRWCFAKDHITGNIDLNRALLSEIKGIKKGRYDLDSLSDKQLQQIATDIIQPYINKKLSVTINDKTYPVTVDRIVNNGGLFTIWLSVYDIGFNNTSNQVRIDYRLLFEETDNVHISHAYGFLSDATGDALQRAFDFSQAVRAVYQTTFDSNNHIWQFLIKGNGGNL